MWDEPFLFKTSADDLIHKCVADKKAKYIMWHCYSSTYECNYSGERTAAKVLQSWFWWQNIFKDCKLYLQESLECHKLGNISKQDEMPLNGMIEVEPFDCWEIDFMGPFPPYNSHVYILDFVDYVTKWIEAIACFC